MRTDPGGDASPITRSQVARLIAISWVVGLTIVYLFSYHAWLLPFQLEHLIGVSWWSLTIGPHFQAFVVARLADFGCVAGIFAAALPLGVIAVGRFITDRDMIGLMLALAVGFWMLAVAVLVIGAVSIEALPWVFISVMLWLLPAPRQFLGDVYLYAGKTDGWAKLMVLLLLVAAALNLMGALAPPFEYDELEYHLGAPAEYIRAGRIVFLPHNLYSNLPQLTEMLFLLAMVTTSDVGAKILHWSFGILAALVVYGVATRLWTRQVGLTAAALFYCVPFVNDLSQTARVDLATAFFAVLAFGGLLLWGDCGSRRHMWLSALAVGAAVATKWTAVAVVFLPAVGFVLLTGRSAAVTVRYSLLAGMVVAPWAAKNWMLSANPVYPLLYGIFPSSHWSAEQAALFALKHYPTYDLDLLGRLVDRPWHLSFAETGATPLLLLVAPLILLSGKLDPSTRRAGWLFVGAYVAWIFTTLAPWRFLFPAFPLAAMMGAFALGRMGRDRFSKLLLRGCVGSVLAVGFCWMGLRLLVDVEDPSCVPSRINLLQYSLGKYSREDFLVNMGHGTFEPIVWMNKNLPSNANVLYIGEARAYYASHTARWSTAFDQHPAATLLDDAKSEDELVRQMRTIGITHVYVNFSELTRLQRGYNYLRDANLPLLQEMLRARAEEIFHSSRGAVYRLKG